MFFIGRKRRQLWVLGCPTGPRPLFSVVIYFINAENLCKGAAYTSNAGCLVTSFVDTWRPGLGRRRRAHLDHDARLSMSLQQFISVLMVCLEPPVLPVLPPSHLGPWFRHQPISANLTTVTTPITSTTSKQEAPCSVLPAIACRCVTGAAAWPRWLSRCSLAEAPASPDRHTY